MADVYWKVRQVETLDHPPMANVVVVVGFDVIGADGDVTSCVCGSTQLPLPDPESFAEFGTLTEQQILGWVKASLEPGVESTMEQAASRQVQEAQKPMPKIAPLPWASSDESTG